MVGIVSGRIPAAAVVWRTKDRETGQGQHCDRGPRWQGGRGARCREGRLGRMGWGAPDVGMIRAAFTLSCQLGEGAVMSIAGEKAREPGSQ